jgi:cytochrome bd-type quinol oxidase subunit 2
MYRLWVLIHLFGVAGFLAAHGVSVFAMFATRTFEDDRERILEWCEASRRTTAPMYISFGLLLFGGVAAGIDRALFAQWWLLGSLLLLLLLTALMSVVASPYMKRLREGCTRWADGSYTMSDQELRTTLAGPATMITTTTGGLGLVVILYLMVFKPGA